MVSGGGGGGKKIPPGGGGAPPKAPKAVSTPPSKPISEPPKPAPAAAEKPAAASAETRRTDAFDSGFKSMARVNSDVIKLDEAFSHAGSPSGIENLVRMLEAARSQLTAEHKVLRDQAQSVIEKLVQSGFAPAQLEKARAELLELRKKMAALRKRLHHLQRRLKSAFATAGKTGDANFAKLLGAQLEKLKKMEPGMARALLALHTIEQAYGAFSDGSTPILRVHVGETGAARLGDAIVSLAPGAAISKATFAMLREGPAAVPAAAGDHAAAPPELDGMRALTDALTKT